MFNKLKARLRLKLRIFLGISEIEVNFVNNRNTTDYAIRGLIRRVSSNTDCIDANHRTIQSMVSVGADIRRSEYDTHSWAVVCIEGKVNIVKFVDLERRDSMEILRFLKQFEADRHCIDSPYKEMFYEGIWKF